MSEKPVKPKSGGSMLLFKKNVAVSVRLEKEIKYFAGKLHMWVEFSSL